MTSLQFDEIFVWKNIFEDNFEDDSKDDSGDDLKYDLESRRHLWMPPKQTLHILILTLENVIFVFPFFKFFGFSTFQIDIDFISFFAFKIEIEFSDFTTFQIKIEFSGFSCLSNLDQSITAASLAYSFDSGSL